MKIGELMMPFRIMLVGGKFGPDVFKIAELLGKEEVIARIASALAARSPTACVICDRTMVSCSVMAGV